MSAPGALGESEVEPTRPFGVAAVSSPSEPVIDKSCLDSPTPVPCVRVCCRGCGRVICDCRGPIPSARSNGSSLTRMLREDLVRILAERDLFRRQLDERPTREEYVALAEACESWSVRAKKAEAMLEAIRAAVKS